MLEQQDYCCAICRLTETKARASVVMALAVDHNHRTGKVRGLLCNACNLSIGKMRDDPTRLRAAATYLEKYNG